MHAAANFDELDVLKQIAQSTQQVFFLYNLSSGQLDYINDNFKKIWEKKANTLAKGPATLLSTIHEGDREFVKENYEAFLKGPTTKNIQFRISLTKKGESIKWISLSAFKILKEGKLYAIAGFAEDITIRQERENNAAKFNTRKNAVLDILNHEIKGSLGMIAAINEQAEAQANSGNTDKVSQYTNIIKQICKHNVELIRSLLNSELVESADIALIRKRLDLVENLKIMVEEYKHSSKDLNRHFHFHTTSEQVFVHVDEVLFTQVFSNLISNAIKFTHEEGNITIALEDKEDAVIFSVSDDGIGIPKHIQPTVFERFTKARRAGLRGEESVGLGMSIIKRIVEVHGGKLWLESEVGKGACFYVEIKKEWKE